MQFLIDNWMLILLALASGAMLVKPLLGQGAGSVSPSEAVRLINREKAVLIDVREAEHFKSIANSSFVFYDSVGHMPQEEIPLRSAIDVMKFLQQ